MGELGEGGWAHRGAGWLWRERGYVSSSDGKSQEVSPEGRCLTDDSKQWGVSKPIPFWFGGDFLGCARVMV